MHNNKLTKLEKIILKVMKMNKLNEIGIFNEKQKKKQVEEWTKKNIEVAKIILTEFEKIDKK